jgi:hypothetical protein
MVEIWTVFCSAFLEGEKMIGTIQRIVFATLCLTVSQLQAGAADCAFRSWFSFKGTDIFRHKTLNVYAYATRHKVLDADGAPNAYHPGDVGKNCLKDEHVGLDCPANAGYPNTNWWPDVLAQDPLNPGHPYIQPSGKHQGFFVTKTWLEDPTRAEIDPARYVDSNTVPYIVFPGSKFPQLKGTGNRGDVGFALDQDRGTSTAFIVADKGGGKDAKLGEASIALFRALGEGDINARTGDGFSKNKTLFVVFPYSGKSVSPTWPRTQPDIDTQVAGLLEKIGGIGALKSCKL